MQYSDINLVKVITKINRRKTISLPNDTLLRLLPFTPDPDRPPDIRLSLGEPRTLT